jgi:hypothetical protein
MLSFPQCCGTSVTKHPFRSNRQNFFNNPRIEMRLFILYNLQLEIINFLCRNFRHQIVRDNPVWVKRGGRTLHNTSFFYNFITG